MFEFGRNVARLGCLAVAALCVVGAAGATSAEGADATTAIVRVGREHWAFQPVRESEPPKTDSAWCHNDIDRFLLATLQEKGLTPSPPADKQTLIRRATFDLIGLPPTPEEIDAFVQDNRPDAFARVVDRLLDSPHYGERWGRYWLDLARYADDQGNSFLTPSPHAYVYRDWVISALNRDMPYNQFLRLQLAGDLIPEPTTDYVERLGGLGFQGLGPRFRKGAAGEAKAKADELEDRVDTLSRGLLGLTVACARCHDHKFDPIPTRDYYGLAAAYNGAQWTPRALASPAVVAQLETKKQAVADLKAKIEKWPAEEGKRIGRQELSRLDAYLIAVWEVQTKTRQGLKADEAAIAQHAKVQPYFLARLLKYLSSSEPMPLLQDWRAAAGPATVAKVDELEIPAPLRGKAIELNAEVADVLGIRQDGDKPATQPVNAPSTRPIALDASAKLLVKNLWENADAPFAVPIADVSALLDAPARQTFEQQKAALKEMETPSPSDPPISPSVSGGGEQMHIYIRGNPEQLGAVAPPGFLSILEPEGKPAPRDHFTRLDLADAIINPNNPLTARVFVNRVWHYHFGRGIVASLGNFGARGDLPTHPELLDTLAARFMKSGWSIKWLHRQIMLSQAYQLGSATSAANVAKDADNRYLWRFSTRRLDVEAWRDAMLAVSGRLNPQVGGTALDPKEPGEHMAGFPAIIRLRGLLADDPNNGRRTVYCIVSRYAPNQTLRMFDFPEPNVASDHRNVTTIPQQQLFVLNSPFMLAISKGFAGRLEKAEPSDDARLELAWRLAYARSITPQESERCHLFLKAAADASDKLTPWEQLSQAVLSSNEFAFLP